MSASGELLESSEWFSVRRAKPILSFEHECAVQSILRRFEAQRLWLCGGIAWVGPSALQCDFALGLNLWCYSL